MCSFIYKWNEFNKKIGAVSFFIHPIDLYRINLGISISLFRLCLIVFIFSSLSYSIICHTKINKKILLFLFGILLSITISSLHITDLKYALSFYINDIMGVLIILSVLITFCSRGDVIFLSKSLVYSVIFPFLFSVYVYYMFFVLNELVDTLPFTEYVSAVIDDGDGSAARVGLFPRLCFPYFTPPFLAIMISIYIVLVFYSKREIVNNLNFFIKCILIFLLIGCLTRTVYLSLLLTFIIGICFYKLRKTRIIIQFIKYLLIIGIIVALIYVFLPSEITELIYKKFFDRLSVDTSDGPDRHVLLIYEAFYIIFGSIENFLFGIGDQDLSLLKGVNTFLAPSMLNSYLTLFTYRGLVGLVAILPFYFYPFCVLKRNISNDKLALVFFLCHFNVMCAFVTYELRPVFGVWLYMSIVYLYIHTLLKKQQNKIL
jgi:hypothetical protein